MSQSSTRRPRKKRGDFPLTKRVDGRWQKKVHGRTYYFSGTQQEVLDEWLRVKDDLLAGRKPRPKGESVTVKQLVNTFLSFKEDQTKTGELSPVSWKDYKKVCDRVMEVFGGTREVETLGAGDFAELRTRIAVGRAPTTVRGTIARIRVLFNWAYSYELIDKPIRCLAATFKPPDKHVMRRYKNVERGERLFSREQCHALLAASEAPLRACLLGGLNLGLGNADLVRLRQTHIQDRWLNYPRGKTGVARRGYVWAETQEAWDTVGLPLPYREFADITVDFRRTADSVGIKTKHLGFYTCRRVFRTVADEVKDPVAVDLCMGHADSSMGATYRERIEDHRLETVAAHVHDWLFNGGPK